jgi:hypothetical protein
VARLTAGERKRLPKRAFAGPDQSFPVNDKKHARLAISGATRSEHAGNISAEEAARIKAKARKKLKGRKRGGKADGERPADRADKPRRSRALSRASDVQGHESKPHANIETDRRPGYTVSR